MVVINFTSFMNVKKYIFFIKMIGVHRNQYIQLAINHIIINKTIKKNNNNYNIIYYIIIILI